MRYETRLLTREEALAFIANMQYFAGMGRITAIFRKGAKRGSVRATKRAWSNWVPFKKTKQSAVQV